MAGLPDFFGGQHTGVACAACHVTRAPRHPRRVAMPIDALTFKNLPTSCTTCHADVHLGQVGSDCTGCHTIATKKFAPVGFSHDRAAFALTGRHQNVECRACHKRETGRFPAGEGETVRLTGLGMTCASCHRDPHLGQLGAACERCHGPTTFKLTSYTHTHPGATVFQAGAHAGLACSACHKPETSRFPTGSGTAVRYAGVGTACARCHEDAHRGTLGATCETCHAPTRWRDPSRAFHKAALFPLEGRHLTVECAACHVQGVVRGTPTRCYDCHWIRRQDDPYRARLGADCGQCHRPTGWTAVTWNHAVATGVPLSALHQTLGCDACHRDRTFQTGGASCLSCHQEEYQRAANPNHAASGFPTSCEICHRASHVSWRQAVFNHSASFQLVGTHATQACQACHKNNVYKGTPRECYPCHQTRYDQTRSPNHRAAGFPTSCDVCHRAADSSWNQGRFNHTWFPITSGKHAGNPCSACHQDSNNYKSFTCLTCHDRNSTDRKHSGKSGYRYDSSACYACHPNGRED